MNGKETFGFHFHSSHRGTSTEDEKFFLLIRPMEVLPVLISNKWQEATHQSGATRCDLGFRGTGISLPHPIIMQLRNFLAPNTLDV